MDYNLGNYNKYHTKNKLKRKMIFRFEKTLMDLATRGTLRERGKALKILDVGCGEGFITRLIKDNMPNAEVTGVDVAEEALVVARRQSPDIEFSRGNVYALDFEDQEFGLVLCCEVLEHLESPTAALDELKRISSGSIIISVPIEPWFCLGNLLTLHNVARLGNPVDHINHWTFSGFKRYIDSEFSAYEREYVTSFPWSIACVNGKARSVNDTMGEENRCEGGEI